MTTVGKTNKGEAPPVPPCSESSPEPAKKEDPQSDPSASEKANEPDQADESADLEEEKVSESSSTAPEEPGLENNKDEHEKTGTPPTSPCGKTNKGKAPPVPPRSSLSPKPAKKADPADEPADFEEEKKSHQESSAAPEEPGLKTTLSESGSEQTTAQAEENSTPTDEAATDQQADRNKGHVDSMKRRFDPKFCEKS
ncbi:uncharacterized protein LOC113748153 [Larimichthys crocea]|uniref:uncharacterized protein LOC113748153 n=1 Tax=Larimichthys crocea TaxID=215358 RepID=UPI000F5FA7BE|nr:uncharacterized protein LOC113748153 [Larimichthys crocea]